MTCSKAFSRAPASPRTSRSSRNFPHATTSPRAGTTAGRAATGSCCHGFSGCADAARGRRRHERAAADRPLEDARQSAPHAFGAGLRRGADGGLDPAAATPRSSGPRSSWRRSCCRRSFRCLRRSRRGAPASRCAAICARSATDLRLALRSPGCMIDVPRRIRPGLMSDAIVRTLWRLFVSAPASAANGSPRRRQLTAPRLDLARLLSSDVGARSPSRCGGRGRRWFGARRLAAGDAFRGALARFAGSRALGQPVAARRRPAGDLGRPTRSALR